MIGTDIGHAAKMLMEGNLVAIPTETVYGLAANALDEAAVKKIFDAKNRPANNPVILHFANKTAILPYVEGLTNDAHKLADAFWPGPLTLLLPKTAKVPNLVTAGSNRVAVRVPNHLLTLKLLTKLGFPVAAPSANPSGYISPTLPEHVEKQLGNKVAYILNGGPCPKGIESTILGWDAKGLPVIYRLGSITQNDIESVLGVLPKIISKEHKKLEAPGMLKAHYAPKTPTKLSNDILKTLKDFNGLKVVAITLMPMEKNLAMVKNLYLSVDGNLEEIAHNLYKTLHAADALNADAIIVEKAPDDGLGLAINDRLSRAASLKG